MSRFIPSEANHEASRRWIESITNARISVIEPTLVLPEVAGAIARQTRNPDLGSEIAASITFMRLVRFEPLDNGSAHLAADLAADLMIKGSDSVYLAVAESHGYELVTWDQTQLERGGSRVPVHRPSDLLAAQRGAE